MNDWLAANAIGEIRGLQSSFCFNPPFDPDSRLFDPAQAGGSLLDLGIYNLAMTQWALQAALGACPEPDSISATGLLGPTGVDHRVAASLQFPGGIVSQFQCGLDGAADNSLRIFGERGVITVPERFWEGSTATLQTHGTATRNCASSVPDQRLRRRDPGGDGAASRRGEVESAVMPHADTVTIAAWMDRIRAIIGLKYPFE